MIMTLVVMWFAAEPNLQPQIEIDWGNVILVASVLVMGLVFLTGWAVATIWERGDSAERVVAALFLAPVVATSAVVGWWQVYFNGGIDSLITSYGLGVVIFLLGFIVMPIVAVGGFIWLMRRIRRKPSGSSENDRVEPDV